MIQLQVRWTSSDPEPCYLDHVSSELPQVGYTVLVSDHPGVQTRGLVVGTYELPTRTFWYENLSHPGPDIEAQLPQGHWRTMLKVSVLEPWSFQSYETEYGLIIPDHPWTRQPMVMPKGGYLTNIPGNESPEDYLRQLWTKQFFERAERTL